MKKTILSKKYWILGFVIVIVVGWWFMKPSTSDIPAGIEIEAITRGDVSEIISETGSVVAAQEVNLAFERGGRVSEIPVTEGQKVLAGDVLLQLNSTQQSADLASAYARLDAEQLRLKELKKGADSVSLAVTESGVNITETTLENAKRNLVDVTMQQDQLVQNAEATLRSSNLQAYFVSGAREDSTYSYAAPTITGTYEDGPEGTYIVELYNSGASSGSSFRVSGLESDTQSVSTVNPTPLGTHGLYIQFPESFAPRTEWEIPVPNTRSSSYLTNLNTLNAAREARNVAIASAENAVRVAEATVGQSQSQLTQVSGSARDERILAQEALVRQMESSVLSAQVAYNNMTLRAPFDGTVTTMNAEIGQILSPGVPTVSVVSAENLELLVYISESDIQEINTGDTATILFDAYDGFSADGQVTSIAPNAKMVDGVRVFEVRLQFTDANDLFRPGLSADINILAATRSNVLAIPSRAVVEREDGKFVRAITTDNKLEYIPVIVGLRGSDGMTEIVDGLTEGQEIITFGQEDAIKQLESN